MMRAPLRPPAVPLVTVDPYFSIWSMADNLYDDATRHWTGHSQPLVGMICVDGRTYRFMGQCDEAVDSQAIMKQTELSVKPLTTTYTFQGGNVELRVTFTTPLLLDDLNVLSRSASYINFAVRSTDGASHDVVLYVDMSTACSVDTPDQEVEWSAPHVGEGLLALRAGKTDPSVLGRVGDDIRIDWGYQYLVVPSEGASSGVYGRPSAHRSFLREGILPPASDHRMPRAVSDDTPVLASVLRLGSIGPDSVERFVVLAYDDIHSVEYFGKPLDALWRQGETTFDDMLRGAIEERETIMRRCEQFDEHLLARARSVGGEAYADIVSLAYRQAIAAHKLVAGPEGELLFFSKECFSNGCMATVDVSYPSIPLFLLYEPELVKAMMRPVLRYAASPEWPFNFAPHDVGTYPLANGQVYGENKLEFQMPVEECGNMLVMAAAVSLLDGHANFAAPHINLFRTWADYLVGNGLDPGNQLCTDDFAGHLAHNANLSIKAILGIAGYALICELAGDADGKTYYLDIAQKMAHEWEKMALEGDHYKLCFDRPDSWSLKYNLIWDKLFGLQLFSPDVAKREVVYYRQKANRYGTPLDIRSTYTKSDWLVWAASLSDNDDDFKALIEPLRTFLNETPSRVPFTDWYETESGKQVGFQHRSVLGGVFIRLLERENRFK